MSVQVEKLEKNMAKLTIELSAEQFEDAMKKAFNKSKNKLNISSSHKGKAPRAMIEEICGEGTFHKDAADEVINATCMEAMNESGLGIVPRPEVTVDQIGGDKLSIYTAAVAARPEVTLGEYKGIEVEKADATVKPEDVEAELEEIQEQNARPLTVEDRPVANDDQTVIDFGGFVDGKMSDGGKAVDCPLTIGSHSLIDAFKEQLAGKNTGEEYGVNVTFPERYHAAELAGKPATPKVTVRKIRVKELPELDDEFTGEAPEFDTLGRYRKDIETGIPKRKQKEAASKNENHVVDKVMAGAPMEISDGMVEGQIDNMVQDTAHRIENRGLSMGLCMKYTGMTVEQMREQTKPQALKRIQARLMLGEIVKAKNSQVFDERLDEKIAEMTAAYQMEADKLGGYMSGRNKNQMKEDITIQGAVDFLVAEAKLA